MIEKILSLNTDVNESFTNRVMLRFIINPLDAFHAERSGKVKSHLGYHSKELV